jgi:glycerol kinase
MPDYILAIDQGTTGTTVLLFTRDGRLRGRAYKEIHQYYPRPGWVEHDPEEIYRGVIALSRKALRDARVRSGELAGLGITNQRETFVVWERTTGRPVHRAIVWQCRRSAEICEQLREREEEISRRTGLLVDPYFSGTKLKWLLDHDRTIRRRAARGELCFGTIESWLVYKLSRNAALLTDYTNASRTMFMNLERLEWDAQMLSMLGVPYEMLPQLVASRGPVAETARGTITDRPVAINALIGDQQSALYGQGCVTPRSAKVTYGTGAFLLVHTGAERIFSRNRLLATIALDQSGEPSFALEGSVFIAGAAVQWLRDEVGLIRKSSDSERLACQSQSRSSPYLVPAFVGLGAPYWDSEARGALLGLTRGTTRADLVRAAIDSIAYQVRDVIEAIEHDLGKPIKELRVDGGAAANNYLMQFQADLIDGRVIRPKMRETTGLGAAMLAGRIAGFWVNQRKFAQLVATERVFASKLRPSERTSLIGGWHAAVARVRSTYASSGRLNPGNAQTF